MSKEDYLDILDLIPEGSDDPVPMNELEYFTGLEERAIKRLIQQVRLAGHPVISHPDGGYFIPDPDNEEDMYIANRFLSMMTAQAQSRFEIINAIKMSMGNMAQVSFND